MTLDNSWRTAAVLAIVAVFAGTAFSQITPFVPADSYDTLYKPDTWAERYRQTSLLVNLASSEEGIKLLVTQGSALIPSLAGFQSSLPANLTVEPGLTYFALATQAYLALYGATIDALYPALANHKVNNWSHTATNLVLTNGVPPGNGVSLYSFLDYSLVNGPLLLTLPPYTGGYWLLTFYDIHGVVFATVGSRQGDRGGKYLLVNWEWEGEAPEDVKVIRAYTPEGILLGRTSFDGTGSVNWTLGWKVGPWGDAPQHVVTFPPGAGFGYPHTTPSALWAVNSADPWAFWKVAGEAWKRNGPGKAFPAPLQSELHRLGLHRDFGFVSYGLNKNVTDALAAAPILAGRIQAARWTFLGTPATNYWYLPTRFGNWGDDYVLAGGINKAWVSNLLEDAAYYFLSVDNTGTPFIGSNTYELVFPRAPPSASDAFWSVQAFNTDAWTLLYGPASNLPALSSPVAGLYVKPDGSIPIRIQNTAPPANTTAAQRGWNWVPSFSGHYLLILRVYAGSASVLSNTYVPPPVVKHTNTSTNSSSSPTSGPSPAPTPSRRR